jgi:hypothetical protein
VCTSEVEFKTNNLFAGRYKKLWLWRRMTRIQR